MRLRLHTRAQNSAGERVRIVLNLKGLDYDYVSAGALNSVEYRRLNPQGLMPSLEIDGMFVTQSIAIIDLLEELAPSPSVYPADPILKAQSKAFALAISSELHPVTVHRVRKYLGAAMGQDESALLAWYRHWTKVTFDALEETLRRRSPSFDFSFANYPTVADAALVPQMANARRFGCDLVAWPLLSTIDRRCQDHLAFQSAQPENQPDFI